MKLQFFFPAGLHPARNGASKALPVILMAGFFSAGFCQTYTITDFGAKGGGKVLNTQAIQAAIDSAAKAGGGKVIVPPDTFLTGTIVLKSNIELHLSPGAVLLGSVNFFDYKKTDRWYALILAKEAVTVSITGKGVIDGRGGVLARAIDSLIKAKVITDPNYSYDWQRPSESMRPQLIEFLKCRKVTVSGITLKNAACWVQTYHDCRDMRFDSLRVESTAFWNNDGIDISDCRNVSVSNCFINAADDGICLKSHEAGLTCDSITVENCTVRSSASAVKFGTASYGGFKNITVKNINVYDTYRSAIAIETVDGGQIENITVSDITAKNTGNALFLRIGHRKGPAPGNLRNVKIRNMKVEVPIGKPDSGYAFEGPKPAGKYNLIPSSIVGLPDKKILNVSLEAIEIIFGGGGKPEVANIPLDSLSKIPEHKNVYPEFSMFGELPATGLFVRHANGLIMKNITVKVAASDFRPAFVFDDVANLHLDTINISPTHKNPEVILNNVIGYIIKNVTASNGATDLVKVIGTSACGEPPPVNAGGPGGSIVTVDNGCLFFTAPTRDAAAVFMIWNIQGRMVARKNIAVAAGTNALRLPADDIRGGPYVCDIRSDGAVFRTYIPLARRR